MNGIRIRVTGLNLHNLFQRAKRDNISFYLTKSITNKTIEFSLDIQDYNKLKSYLDKFYKVQIIKRNGRLAIRELLVRNIGLVVGVFIMVLVAILSTQFVWKIEIYGLENTSRQTIIDALNKHSVRVGGSFNQDITTLENELLQELDSVADISILRKGTTIVVSVSEKLQFSPTTFDPIYSQYNGTITNIELSSGTSCVSVGDFVLKGDQLVLPFILDNMGREVSVRPVARITINAQVTAVSSCAQQEKVLRYTGKEETRSYYKLGKIKLSNIKNGKPFDFCEKIVYNQIVSRGIIPLYKITITYKEYSIEYINHTLESVKQKLIDESVSLASQSVCGEIINTDSTIVTIAGIYYANTTITFVAIQE